jgi:GNAT superfamily N-acetyltransferase
MATPSIMPLATEDRAAWERLARGYKAFYETDVADAGYEQAWRRLLARDGVHGLGGKLDGRLVGIAHYLFHGSAWARSVCYLQDLFVSPDSRGRGVARALIEAVADAARAEGAERYYWLTQEQNGVARALYDRVGEFHGFIRYDYPLRK